MPKKEKLLKILVFVLILILYGSFLVYKIKIPAADDLPRQITIGKEILEGNWNILYENTFSYVEPSFTFFNHHWLSGVFFYILYNIIGWSGLVIFKVLIFFLTFAILFKISLKKADFWLVALISIPVIFILRERTGLRPEVFSYLFIAIFTYLLLDFEKNSDSKRIFWLIPLQLLWVNMHVFFSIGIMLVAGFLFEKIILNWKDIKNNKLIKKLFIVFIAIIIVSFINPRGISGVFYHYPKVSIEISENQSISSFLSYSPLKQDISVYVFRPLVLVMILSFFVFIIYYIKQKRSLLLDKSGLVKSDNIPIFYILAGIATATLSFFVLRGLYFFGVIFLLTVPAYLNGNYLKIKEYLLSKYPFIMSTFSKFLIGCLMLSLIYFIYDANKGIFSNYAEKGLGIASMSEGGVSFFKNNNLKGPIFNDADIGSYLIHYLYPKEKVFADNRFGDAYSASFWDDVYLPVLANEKEWQIALKRYNFNVIFLYQYDNGPDFRGFMYRRIHDPEWAFVYGDAFSIILVKNTLENQDLINKFHITPENAQERLIYLSKSKIEDDIIAQADILNLLDRVDLSRPLFLDVVTKNPNNGKIWMIMGEWELSIDKPENSLLAMMYLDKAIENGQKTAEAYSFLGLAYFRLGQLEKSKDSLEKALELNSKRSDATNLLLDVNRRLELENI